MRTKSMMIGGNDTAEALSTETMGVGAIPQVVVGYIAVDAINKAYRGIVRPRMDVVVIPGTGHPVYVSLSGKTQSFIHG